MADLVYAATWPYDGHDDDEWEGDLPALTKSEMFQPRFLVSQQGADLEITLSADEAESRNDRDSSLSSIDAPLKHTPSTPDTSRSTSSESSPNDQSLTPSPDSRANAAAASAQDDCSPEPALLEDIQHLLKDKTQAQGYRFLQALVVDLMDEIDSLEATLLKRTAELEDLQSERQLWDKDARDNIVSLLLALKTATYGEGVEVELREDHILTDSEATELVIGQLTRKIEKLNIENSKLAAEKEAVQSELEDVKAYNETRQYKIDALEGQFKAINSTRFNLAKKLLDRTNRSGNNNSVCLNDSTCSSSSPAAKEPVQVSV